MRKIEIKKNMESVSVEMNINFINENMNLEQKVMRRKQDRYEES